MFGIIVFSVKMLFVLGFFFMCIISIDGTKLLHALKTYFMQHIIIDFRVKMFFALSVFFMGIIIIECIFF